MTLECAAIFFIPGESLVLIGGFFAARGHLDLIDLILVVSAGAILGYCIGFELGRRFGRPRLLQMGRWVGLREKHLDQGDAFFARYGGGAVFLGRFTWFRRPFVSLAAGSSNMTFRRFLFYNFAGGILWSATFALLGYCFGASWRTADRWMGDASLLGVLMLLVVGARV